MDQPLSESPTMAGKNCSDLRTAATQVDLRHMLEGDVPQELDDKMLFQGYQKTEGPNTVIKRYTQGFYYGGTRWQVSRELAPQKDRVLIPAC